MPSGGEIHWVTYYFRDRALARALVRAHRRGVRVGVAVDGAPRLPGANDTVREILAGAEGIGPGFRAVTPPRLLPGIGPRGRVHAKIYCFSHPRPTAFIGSFNPSGDEPDDPAVTARIGDQDRGYNTLVEIGEPALVAALAEHARAIRERGDGRLWRLRVAANRAAACGGTQLCFYPRLDSRFIIRAIYPLGAGDRLWMATSHMKARSVLKALCRARKRGAELRILTHDSERRAPASALRTLENSGVEVRRYRDTTGLPMHDKFMLTERGPEQRVHFGSLNLNVQSQLLNHEVLACSADNALFNAFAERWERIREAASRF